MADALDDWPHVVLVNPAQARRLRRRDALERVMDEIVQAHDPHAAARRPVGSGKRPPEARP